jgi:hypothetical protein
MEKSFPYLKESFPYLEKSSHDVDEAVAVLIIFPHDRERLVAVLHPSFHALLRSVAVRFQRREDLKKSSAGRKLSSHVRGSSFAVMRKSFGGLFRSGAYRCWLESSVRRLLQVGE